ncbi:MAG: alcohol acetyltransferase, partial [Acutalibacteraceae bacterium]
MKNSGFEWFKLDNAAKIFPGQNSRSWSNVFRISVELKEDIDPCRLEKALINIMPRFPSFNVRIKPGFFWYYFEKNPKTPLVSPDVKNYCYRINFKENKNFLFRVYHYGKRISVDVYHAITDGYGCTVFLSTLTAEYLHLCGYEIPSGGFVLDAG